MTESAATFIEHDALVRSFAIIGDPAYEVATRGFGFGTRIFGTVKFSAGAPAFCPDTV